MSTHTKIDKLWEQFRDAIDAANAEGQVFHCANGHAEVNALRDYTRDGSWRLDQLLGREAANERQHRRSSAAPRSFSVADAAKLHLMNAAAWGSTQPVAPSVVLLLTARQTTVEAQTLGYLARKHITRAWHDELQKYDYARLMEV